MCGRYASSRRDADLVEEFEVEDVVGEQLPPSWNVAPTQDVRVVLDRPPREDDTEARRQLRTLRWGLVPSWAKDLSIGSRMINARAESITEKPAFRKAASRRRCLVPADGYYEWQQSAGRGPKTPYFLHAPDGSPLAFAGLFEMWRDPTKADDDPTRWVWTVAVVTTTASDVLGEIHDRTPLLVPRELRDAWLDPQLTDPEAVRGLVASIPEPHLQPDVVGRAVNDVRNDGPELVEPAAPPA